MNPLKVFRTAFRYGQVFGFLLIVGIAGGMWAKEKVENALWFEEVNAVAERVDVECITSDEFIEAATPCEATAARLKDKQRLSEVFRVRTQYRSPADGQRHTGSVLISKNQLKKLDLKHWRVLASKENADEMRLAHPFF